MRFLGKHKYKFHIIGFILLLVTTSCVNDSIEPIPQPDIDFDSSDYALALKMSLPIMTRDGNASFEKYEDYLDITNLRLLFYYVSDDNKSNTLIKQFKQSDFHIIPIQNTLDEHTNEWRVMIPISEELVEFAEIIRKNNFKIAVLANWPLDGLDDLKEQNIETGELGSNISKLHHLKADTYSKANDNTYDFLFDNDTPNGKMGQFTKWLNEGISKNNAENYIRNTYGPKTLDDAGNYGELWQIWNFNGAYKYNNAGYDPSLDYPDMHVEFSKAWAQRNGEDLQAWIKKTPIENYAVLKTNGQPKDSWKFSFESANFTKAYTKEVNGKIGFVLPQSIAADDGDSKNTIKFMAPNSGILKIKWGSSDGNNAQIKIERRNNLSDGTSKDDSKNENDMSPSSSANEKDFEWSYDITGDAEFMSIYPLEGNPIIYQIEWISPEYLSYIDKHAIVPGPDTQYIPMYGVQEFKMVGDLWEMGSTFDLSNFNKLGPKPDTEGNSKYDYKDIWLIRSVAKVELKLPKDKFAHVFMRSMNHKAYCEPMDVSTSTSTIWKDYQNGSVDHPSDCEWFGIRGHEPFFKQYSTKPSSEDQWKNYRSKLAWYYGSWGSEGKVGGVEIEPGDNSNGTNTDHYPQILNPFIERSDFTEFHYAGTSDGNYDRFVMYVPEKFVDDPGSIGRDKNMETTTPKIIHVEFRSKDDPYTNLDDNNCYRIYFTSGGYNPEAVPQFSVTDDNWENKYEKNVENLKKHWPIMRNHLYSFTVSDGDNKVLVVKLEVLPWREVDGNDYIW